MVVKQINLKHAYRSEEERSCSFVILAESAPTGLRGHGENLDFSKLIIRISSRLQQILQGSKFV